MPVPGLEVDPNAVLVDEVKVSLNSDAVRGHSKLQWSLPCSAITSFTSLDSMLTTTSIVNILLSESAQGETAVTRSHRKAGKCSVYMSDLAMQ